MMCLLLSCLCLLTGITLGHENGPDVVTVNAAEGSDAILPCSLSTKESITSKVFDWKKDDQKVFLYDGGIHYNNGIPGQDEQFQGRVSHFRDELKSGNASIIIRSTRMEDSGVYTCVFPLLQPRQTSHIKLVVERTFKNRSGEITGEAAKPSVRTVEQTETSALLQCEVRGAFPKPELNWQDGAGNILHAEEPKVTERGSSYDIILNITVTKTDYYRCVATQKNISHQIYAQTHVFISESSHGAGVFVGGWLSGVLTLAAVWGLFEVVKHIMSRRKKGSPQTNGLYALPSKQQQDLPI